VSRLTPVPVPCCRGSCAIGGISRAREGGAISRPLPGAVQSRLGWRRMFIMARDISRTPKDVPIGNRTVRMTARVREAVSLMVWRGLKRDEAAAAAGLKDNSLYVALRKPDVRAFYLSECETLRLSGRARRIHRLEQLAEQDRNVAGAVAAIRAAEDLAGDEHAPGRGFGPTSAGFVIVVPSAYLPKDRSPIVDVTPEVQPPEPEPRPEPSTVRPMLRATPRGRR
jgi:hypothetical protein